MVSKKSQSLDRALMLFEAIVRDDGRSSIGQIVADTGIASSSARRLIAALAARRLIHSVGHGRYAGAGNLVTLASHVNVHRTLIEGARPHLSRLARRHGGAAHLGILDNDMVTYLIKEGGSDLFTREGAQLEAYCTGIGKVLLGALPEDRLQKYLAGPFVRMTATTMVEPLALEREICLTQNRGFAIDNCEMSDLLACIAVPLVSQGRCLGAISLSQDVRDFPFQKIEQLAAKLTKLAADIANSVATYAPAAAS